MARSSGPSGPTPVESIRHGEKRVNIPTSDAEEFADPALLELRKAVYTRDESLDPQLVWRGKFDKDVHELVVDAPPVYIQEKIDPRVLVVQRSEAA